MKKNYISSVHIFWDEDAKLIFSNIGWSKVPNKKQDEAIKKLAQKVTVLIIDECKLINKLK